MPTAELPWYRVTWDRATTSRTSGEAFDEHAPLVEELLGADPRRTARCRRPTSSRARRSTGTGGRPTRSGRILEALAEAGHPRDRAARGQPPRLRPDRAPVPPRPARAARARATSSAATGCCRATAATGCSARRGQYTLCAGHRARRPGRRGAAATELVEAGAISPVEVEGFRGQRFVVADELRDARRGRREAARSTAADGRPAGASRASRSSRRSTRWPGTATCCAGCSTSTTSGRSTSRRRSGAGATTCCRSCTATGSSAGSSRASTGDAARSGSLGLWWEAGFDPLEADPGVRRTRSRPRSGRTWRSADLRKFALPRTARHRAFVRAVRGRL